MAYPTLTEAMAAGQLLANSILSGNLLSPDTRKANVKAAYDLEGYALSVIVGDPNEITFGAVPTMTNEAFAEACKSIAGMSENGTFAAIDWKALWVKVLSILLELMGTSL